MYFEASNNLFVANYIGNNRWGIYLSPIFVPENNTFYNNDFVNNAKQVNLGSRRIQIWDNGYPSGGNYWSNYTGTDTMKGPSQNQTGTDGIGDTPFVIGANNTDMSPLISPFNIPNLGPLPTATQTPPIQNNTTALWHLDTLNPPRFHPKLRWKHPYDAEHLPSQCLRLVPGESGQALNFSSLVPTA